MVKKFIPSLFVIALSAGIFLYGQHATDIVLARTFEPSAEVSMVNQRLKLTPGGTTLLYASHASIEGSDSFNQSCQSGERTAAILGCYYKRQIYLYDITNPELDGATEVTAAHEMLHAAYDRLNFFERNRIDQLIKNEYDNLKKDPVIAEEMAYYQKAEPGAEINELHSIIGTTVATVSPELESYYKRYFTDRSSIVALNASYNAVFTDLTKQAEQLQNEINQQERELKLELSNYDSDRQQLEGDIQAFNDRASSHGFSSQSSFNTARNALIARVSEMNDRRSGINAAVESYNNKIAELSKLSVKVNEINKSLNGVEAPSGI
jgi:hypothetical protein